MGIADLTGPRMKLRRADEHLDALERELRVFGEQYPEMGRVTVGRDSEWYVVHVNPAPAVPPHIALVAGDCLMNIRAALDHLVWQLVLREDQIPGKRTEFPIYNARQEFIDKCVLPTQRGKKTSPLYGIPMGGDAWTLIEAAQPFQSTEPQHHMLACLQKLSNIDKHNTLLVQETFIDVESSLNVPITWSPEADLIEQQFSAGAWSEKHPTEISRLRFALGKDPDVHVQGRVTMHPSIGDGKTQLSLRVLHGALTCARDLLDKVATLPRVQP